MAILRVPHLGPAKLRARMGLFFAGDLAGNLRWFRLFASQEFVLSFIERYHA